MKKIPFILFLLLMSTSSNAAEWVKVAESGDDGGYIVYADMSSIHNIKDDAKMWTLIDFKIEQEETGATFSSKMIRSEYDCKGKHIRILAYKLFSWEMGQGELVRAYTQPQKWEKIQPGSITEAQWKVACSQ